MSHKEAQGKLKQVLVVLLERVAPRALVCLDDEGGLVGQLDGGLNRLVGRAGHAGVGLLG